MRFGRQIDARDSCHEMASLLLTLLVTRIALADHADHALRRTSLQCSQIFFTDERTFMLPPHWSRRAPVPTVAVDDATAAEIVGKLDRDLVARKNLDEMHPHLPEMWASTL
jgi:hypothetical protein